MNATSGEIFQTCGRSAPLKRFSANRQRFLNNMTGGVVRAEVTSAGGGGSLTHQLYLVAPALDNYRFLVLTVAHDINIYPCRLLSAVNPGTWVECGDEQDFENKLGTVLSNPKTRRIIESLISQSS